MPSVKACFRGGPLDGQFRELPSEMQVFEVARPAELTLSAISHAPGDRVDIVRGRYWIVPREDDSLWRIARLYEWRGWDDDRPDETPQQLHDTRAVAVNRLPSPGG